ncbi:MAG: hypothetical protein GDA56_10390 [Hormoscilla sp. GM7CHS1pb]|nr:hypothetical protein [Hormoscilla sp. GM7CHS1pb]
MHRWSRLDLPVIVPDGIRVASSATLVPVRNGVDETSRPMPLQLWGFASIAYQNLLQVQEWSQCLSLW